MDRPGARRQLDDRHRPVARATAGADYLVRDADAREDRERRPQRRWQDLHGGAHSTTS
jgi:hypothetical protein